MWWFDYAKMCICLRVDLGNGQFLVDFDANNSTAALDIGYDHPSSEYGNYSHVRKVKDSGGRSKGYAWAFRVSEKYVNGPAHFRSFGSEWLYFWAPKTEPPTD